MCKLEQVRLEMNQIESTYINICIIGFNTFTHLRMKRNGPVLNDLNGLQMHQMP